MPPSATLGRRERKKLQTHRALATAARELALARGLDGLTVEDIADAADVSVRTFFNYFSCKEAALVGALAARLGTDVAADPFPAVAVAAAMATLRATAAWWEDADRPGSLDGAVDRAFATLA